MSMSAKIENNKLVVTIDLETPRPSASGKTLVVATSGGNKATAAQINGQPVIVGFNAYLQR